MTESPIRIDLNKPYFRDDIRRLLESVEDDRNWTLIINYRGEAFLRDFDEVRKQISAEDNVLDLRQAVAGEGRRSIFIDSPQVLPAAVVRQRQSEGIPFTRRLMRVLRPV